MRSRADWKAGRRGVEEDDEKAGAGVVRDEVGIGENSL